MKKIDSLTKIIASMIVFLIFAIFITFYFKSPTQDIKYVEFVKMLEADNVDTVFLRPNATSFLFLDKEYNRYISPHPMTDNFRENLLIKGVNINDPIIGGSDGNNTVGNIIQLSVGLFIIYFIFRKYLLYSAGTALNGYKIDNKSDTEDKNSEKEKVYLKDVEGIDELKEDLSMIINALKNPKKHEEMGARMPKGIILYGPPGTGKTLTAKALANEADVAFFSVSGSDFVEKYVGVGAKRVRELYKEAKENSPCIVFIDEIDAVGRARGTDQNSERDQTINALLTMLDGFNGSEGIITIAATNMLEDLDPALVRPGRFDKHLAISLPDKDARYKILKLNAANKQFDKDVDLEELSKMTVGFSGAGLETLLNEAALLAVNNDQESISQANISNAYYKVILKGSLKNDQASRSSEELELVAWHEAGHALLTKLLTEDEVTKVTILASTSGAGGVTIRNPKEVSLHSKKDIRSQIAIMYGGRIAEYLLLKNDDKITTGASNDIQQATNLIKRYINDFGMSNSVGMINMSVLTNKGDDSILIKEAIELSNQIYEKALSILSNNKDLLEEIALSLLAHETLSNEDLDKILARYNPKL